MCTNGTPQAMLVFTESILIAQYVYQIPSRLHCSAVTPRIRAAAEEAGLHGNALRGVPIFCVYLATLMHTYSLARQKVPPLDQPSVSLKATSNLLIQDSFPILQTLCTCSSGPSFLW